MKRTTNHLIAAIAADNPQDFEKQFNEKMMLLSDNNPEATIDISNGFRAVIRYDTETSEVDTIADEFHRDGICHICRECPLHDNETNKRRKWVTCKYSESGLAHLDHECCEYFYKQVKLGHITPGEPNRSGRVNRAPARR